MTEPARSHGDGTGPRPDAPDARDHDHRRLAAVDTEVLHLFALVGENIAAATDALLTSDPVTAQAVTTRERRVGQLEADLDHTVERLLLRTPVAGDMRYLRTVLRVVPQLERCGDLAEHIARRAATDLGSRLTPTLRGLLTDIGGHCSAMWNDTALAWAERDTTAAARLDRIDDRLDRLHDLLGQALLRSRIARADAIQTTLLGRFYARLGDHAVHIARRIEDLAPRPARSADDLTPQHREGAQ